MIDNIERNLKLELKCDAVIHMDPIANDDEQTLQLKEQITAIVYEMSQEASLHDFRIVKGPTHTNIIFDICVPYGFDLNDSQIKSYLAFRISELDQSYYAVITIDKNFT